MTIFNNQIYFKRPRDTSLMPIQNPEGHVTVNGKTLFIGSRDGFPI